MNIYVFGSGFISSHLVKKLKALKHKITIIHHDEPYEIKKADYIIYLSSYGNHFNQKDEHQTVKANFLDLYTLLRATKDVPYKGFIHISTSSVTLPVQTLYSDTKFMGEIICRRFAKKYNKPIVSIRPFSVYGPGEAEFRFIPTCIKTAKEGRTMKISPGSHDWIYVSDFVTGVIAVMKKIDKVVGKAVPIGTGRQCSNFYIGSLINGKNVITMKDTTRPYDTQNWVADITIMKGLGWKPKVTLEEGIKKLYDHS